MPTSIKLPADRLISLDELVKTTAARMPKGLDSTLYLHFIYWLLVAVWLALIIDFAFFH